MSHSALNRALQEHSDPTAELVLKIADALDISLEYLLRGRQPARLETISESAVTSEARQIALLEKALAARDAADAALIRPAATAASAAAKALRKRVADRAGKRGSRKAG